MVAFNVSFLRVIEWVLAFLLIFTSKLSGPPGGVGFMAWRPFPGAGNRLIPARFTVQGVLERADDD
jgi:hypothetical protein